MGCSASTPTPSALAEERVSSPHGKQQRPSFGKDEPRGNSPQLSQQSRFEAPFAPAAVTSRCDAPQWVRDVPRARSSAGAAPCAGKHCRRAAARTRVPRDTTH